MDTADNSTTPTATATATYHKGDDSPFSSDPPSTERRTPGHARDPKDGDVRNRFAGVAAPPSADPRNGDVDNNFVVDATAAPALSAVGWSGPECGTRGPNDDKNNNNNDNTNINNNNANGRNSSDVDGGIVSTLACPVGRLDLGDDGSDWSGGNVTPREVTVQTAGEVSKKLKFNIGGTLFQTKEATIDSEKWQEKGIKLANRDFLSRFYDEEQDEYFLDRDPEVFRVVLNLLRSGRLHVPSYMCGQQAKEELQFWGVSPLQVEPCCWSKLNSWNATRKNLKLLERDVLNIRGSPRGDNSRCSRCMIAVWRTLTNPAYSLLAKIYGWISFFFVLLAIFSFCASTHPFFRVPIPGLQDDLSNITTTTTSAANATNHTTTPLPPLTSTTQKTVAERLKETEVNPALQYVDYLCLAFFTLEYVLRLIASPRKLRFIRSFKGIIDLLAIAPDYVEIALLIFESDALINNKTAVMFMPFLRVVRAFRIFRLFRHLPGLWIMVYTIQSSYNDLFLMFAFLMVGTLFFASLVFFVDDKEIFTSIPHGFWWAIVTMTTVGYGDMYPVTWPGHVLGSVTAVSGVLMIGFTIPALVNNFILYYDHVQFVREKAKLTKEIEAEEKAIRDEEERERQEALAKEAEEEEQRRREREEEEERTLIDNAKVGEREQEETAREMKTMTTEDCMFAERYRKLSV